MFGHSFCCEPEKCRVLEGVGISHREPATTIGSIRRPLIFPHAIFDRCRGMWQAKRPVRFSFAGLLTRSRRAQIESWIVESWIVKAFPARPTLPGRLTLRVLPVVGSLFARLGLAAYRPTTKLQVGDLHLWSSWRGRTELFKAWDQEYFDFLAASQFVLCPSGDFTWTYRFFEAILCGAIPVVEAPCPAYAGFRYYSMDDPAAALVWDAETVAQNYARCRELLTIPRDELNRELAALLAAG